VLDSGISSAFYRLKILDFNRFIKIYTTFEEKNLNSLFLFLFDLDCRCFGCADEIYCNVSIYNKRHT